MGKKKELFLWGIVVLFITFYFFIYKEYLYFKLEDITKVEIKILRILNLIMYAITIFLSYKFFKYNYIVFLFLISLFIFQYGRINFLWVFGEYTEEMTWFANNNFTNEIKIFTTELLFYNILGNFIGVLFCALYKKNILEKKYARNEKYYNIIFFILLLLAPVYIYGQYNIIKTITEVGYLEVFKNFNKIMASNNFIVAKILGIYGILVFLLLSIVHSNKKNTIITFFIFISINILFSLRGGRASLVTAIFFLIWYYCFFYEKKINLVKIFLVFLTLIMLSIQLQNIRSNDNKNGESNLKKIERFIFEQGVTGTFLAVPITHPEVFRRETPYIITGIIGEEISSQEKDYQKVEKSKRIALSYKMSYVLDKNLFLIGAGTGGNYILEMYDLIGKFGVFILSFFSILIIYGYSILIKWTNNLILRAILLSQLPAIFFIPRSSYIFFKVSLIHILGYFTIGLFLIIIVYIKSKKYFYNE